MLRNNKRERQWILLIRRVRKEETDFKTNIDVYAVPKICSELNDEYACEFYQNSKVCLSKGGFHLRKWASDSTELFGRIQDDCVKWKTTEA